MQVDPILRSPHIQSYSFKPLSYRDFEYKSTLEGIREFGSRKRISFISRLFTWIQEGVMAFAAWVASWSPRRAKVVQKVNEVDYFRVLDTDAERVRYRLSLNGKGTENEINFGRKHVHLEEISFPDKGNFSKLPKMIALLMEKEKIDCIRTSNLIRAKILWDCGLHTDYSLIFKPERQDPLNQLFKKVIRKAFKKRVNLDNIPHKALRRVEESIVRCIIAEAISYDDATNHTALHQSVADSSQGSLALDPHLAKAKIAAMEKILSHSFNLKDLAKRAEKKGDLQDQMYSNALKMVAQLKPDQTLPSSGAPVELQISLSDFFILMEAAEISLDRTIIQDFPNIIFSKKD